MRDKTKVTITLSKANAELAAIAASLLKKTIEEVVFLCLQGSTNPSCSEKPDH